MQLVTSANSIWPAAAPSVVYAQLGDLVEMMLHPKDAVFATCGFCQTLNRRGATRCRACGGSFLPSDESDPLDTDETADERSGENAETHGEPLGRPVFSDLPALRSMLLLVLVPPMLMFLAFFAWNKLRVSDAAPVGLPDRSSIESVLTVPNSNAQAMLPSVPQDEPVRQAQTKPEARPHVEHVERDAGTQAPAAIDGTSLAEVEAAREVQKTIPARPRPVPSHQALRQQGSPVAACSGYSFIARAVCVNKSCAQPRAAQHAECREANRQRRIDESRRNPVLMG